MTHILHVDNTTDKQVSVSGIVAGVMVAVIAALVIAVVAVSAVVYRKRKKVHVCDVYCHQQCQ